MPEGYGIVPRALGDLEALETPVNVAPVNIYQHNTQEDTVNAAALMQKEGVAVIIVMGVITSPSTVEVGGKKLETKNIIVATGSTIAQPDVPGLDQAAFTTDQLLDMEIAGYNMPEDLYYDQYHFWTRVDGDELVIGMVGLGLVGDRPLGLTGGWIPAGPPRSYVYGDTILAGDAAGHTHPITGAGIFQAVVGGAMAGRWAARAVLEDDLTLLRKYEEEWADFYGDALSHAHQRRQQWEAHTGSLDAAIRKFWIGFREYYAAS